MNILLTILLTALKVILIIVLIILALVLAILLLVLFCPFTYRISGNIKKAIKETGADGEVRWLFGAIGGGGIYDDRKLEVYLRIFSWRKYLMEKQFGSGSEDSPDAGSNGNGGAGDFDSDFGSDFDNDFEDDFDYDTVPEPHAGNANAVNSNAVNSNVGSTGSTVNSGIHAVQGLPQSAEPKTAAEPETTAKPEPPAEPEIIPPPYTIPEEPDEPDTASIKEKLQSKADSILSRILQAIDEGLAKLNGLSPAMENTVNKIRGLLDKIKEYEAKAEAIYHDPVNQGAVRHLLKEVLYILKTLIPEKLTLDLTYSAGSPDLTGQVLAVIALVPYAYSAGWDPVPDFEADKPYAEGKVQLTGAFFLYKYVGVLLRVILDSNCRKLYKKIKKLKEK